MSSIINPALSPWDIIQDWITLEVTMDEFDIDFTMGDYNELSLDLMLISSSQEDSPLGGIVVSFQVDESVINGYAQFTAIEGEIVNAVSGGTQFASLIGSLSYRNNLTQEFYTTANLLLKSGNGIAPTFVQYTTNYTNFDSPDFLAGIQWGVMWTDQLITNLNKIRVSVGDGVSFAGFSAYRLLGRKI